MNTEHKGKQENPGTGMNNCSSLFHVFSCHSPLICVLRLVLHPLGSVRCLREEMHCLNLRPPPGPLRDVTGAPHDPRAFTRNRGMPPGRCGNAFAPASALAAHCEREVQNAEPMGWSECRRQNWRAGAGSLECHPPLPISREVSHTSLIPLHCHSLLSVSALSLSLFPTPSLSEHRMRELEWAPSPSHLS